MSRVTANNFFKDGLKTFQHSILNQPGKNNSGKQPIIPCTNLEENNLELISSGGMYVAISSLTLN